MSKICPACGKTHMAAKICPYCGNAEPPNIDSLVEEYTQNLKPLEEQKDIENQEYRRTCRNCGKIWHSLVSRENKLKTNESLTKMRVVGSTMQSASCCFMCGGSKTAQLNRNVDALDVELDRLKSCPECRSKNYSEELMTYEK